MRRLGLVSLGVLIACSEHGIRPDALFDSGPEPPPPTTGPVSLQITNHGVPAAGVAVVFQDASSTPIATVTTDATGTASTTMPIGGFVTVVNPFGPSSGTDELRTYAGVRPFDQLKLDNGAVPPTIRLTVTGPIGVGAASYKLHTSCGSATLVPGAGGKPTGQVTLTDCGLADMVLETFDATGAPLQSLFEPGRVVADGGTVTLTGAYQPVGGLDVTYFDVPFGVTSIDAKSVLATTLGPLLESSVAIDTSTGSGAATRVLPTIGGATLVTESRLNPSGTSIGSHGVLDWTVEGATFVDLITVLLPDFQEAPTFDPPRSFHWLEASSAKPEPATIAPLDQPDAVNIDAQLPPTNNIPSFVMASLHVAGATRAWNWTIVSPYVGSFVSLPILRGSADSFNITTETVTFAGLTTVNVPGGYDAVRGKLLTIGRLDDLVEGQVGRIVFEDLRGSPFPAGNP